MKKTFAVGIIVFVAGITITHAQIGIGTTSPNSTLDVRGSLSMNYRAFTGATTAGSLDNMLVFTGLSGATLTLPDATTCSGRSYWIKNTSSNISLLTIVGTSSQTIDGLANWLLDESNEAIRIVSNGVNWVITANTLPTGSGTNWTQGGNSVASIKKLGTLNNFDLPFITNNVERMRINTAGNTAIGASTFNSTYPERLLVDAGTTGSVNAIVGKGTINSYLQLNIQNLSNGNAASSDVVATADNGSELINFVDMGINGSNYSGGVMGSANDSYLYNMGQNFLIGTGVANKSLVFMTGGTSQASNERMRLDGSGNLGLGTTSPSNRLSVTASSNPLFLGGLVTGSNTDSVLTVSNGVIKRFVANGSAWGLSGNAGTSPATNFLGTIDAQPIVLKVNSNQMGRLDQNSLALGLGATINNSTYSGAIGRNAVVGYNHSDAYALGTDALVNASNSFAIGNDAITNGSNSFAIGNGSRANNANSLAIGPAAITAYSISDAIAIGTNATANASNSIAIGSNGTAASKTVTNASNAIAIGTTVVNNSANAIAIGNTTSIAYSVPNSIGIGNAVTVSGSNGIAIGNGAAIGTISNALALGAGATVTSTGTGSTAIGYNATATLPNEVILGDRTNTAVSVGIGTEAFSSTNREKFLVDAGTSASINAIVGRGNNNNYLQLNIQNLSSGAAASSDVVATADNGNEVVNFIDMGINSGGYSATGILGGANNAYLYTTGNDFVIGNSTNNKSLIFYTTTGGANTERMRINGSGLVPGQDNVYTLGTNPARWSAVWSVNGTIQTSDRRLKTNIATLGYGLKEVMALQPVRYDWKDKSGANKLGLIAQDVKLVIPEVVSGDESKENLGLNYAELVPVLINAIKEQQQEIRALRTELEILKKK